MLTAVDGNLVSYTSTLGMYLYMRGNGEYETVRLCIIKSSN